MVVYLVSDWQIKFGHKTNKTADPIKEILAIHQHWRPEEWCDCINHLIWQNSLQPIKVVSTDIIHIGGGCCYAMYTVGNKTNRQPHFPQSLKLTQHKNKVSHSIVSQFCATKAVLLGTPMKQKLNKLPIISLQHHPCADLVVLYDMSKH